MQRFWFAVLLILSTFAGSFSFACTTAVISGKATPNGCPLLWKHRDSDNFNNKIVYENGLRYNYIGLINSDDSLHQVWAGTNSAGFAIMNSASYNIIPADDPTEIKDLEGFIMKMALSQCATIADFANMLDTLKKPLGVSANFGVIDANGGAGYFEVNNFNYKFFDANNTIDAPNGYLIRTNFSVTGQADKGAGYIRFNTATNLINEAYKKNQLTPEFFLTKASLSLRQDITGVDLAKEIGNDRLYPFKDFIVRYYSSSTVLVQGVKQNETADLTTMWIKLGFQPASIAVPLWVAAGSKIPEIITAPDAQNAKLCNKTLALKEKCFPLDKWDEGENYVQLSSLLNKQQTGYIQLTADFDKEIISKTNTLISKWRRLGLDTSEILNYYTEINKQIELFYSIHFNL